jgi:predicted MPP superfamily phosphohydrolase
VSVRSALARRRRLEFAYGIALNSAVFDESKSPSDKRAARLNYHKDMHKTLTDGVVLVASDCHYWPLVVTAAHQAFCTLAKKLQPKMIVLNGDILDGARITVTRGSCGRNSQS